MAHLEQLVEGLQDSVHREASRNAKRLAELETRTQPGALGTEDLERLQQHRQALAGLVHPAQEPDGPAATGPARQRLGRGRVAAGGHPVILEVGDAAYRVNPLGPTTSPFTVESAYASVRTVDGRSGADITDDDLLPKIGDAMLGTITAHFYSVAHPSAMNKAFVAAFEKVQGSRPNFMVVSGYDGMHLIYEALRKTKGATDSEALIAAMKSASWESPRGPMSIDPATGEVVHNVYIRSVDKVKGELLNVELSTFNAVGPKLVAR